MHHQKPTFEYDDEIVETRRRKIHAFEDLSARISAWHGGRHLSDFSTYTHEGIALEEAQKLCTTYKIDKRSSLHLRVDVERVRSFKTLSTRGDGYEQSLPRQDELIMRRHIWDSHDGRLVTYPAQADVEVIMPIGMKSIDDPGEHLAQLLKSLSAHYHQRAAFLYKGMGLGDIKPVSCERIAIDPPEGDNDSFKRSMDRWAGLVYRGTLDLEIPKGMRIDEVRTHLATIELSPNLDRQMLGRLADRLCIYTGKPRFISKFSYPAAIEGRLPPEEIILIA